MAQPPQQASNQPQTGGAQPPNAGAQLPQQALNPDQLRKMQVMSKQAMGLLLEDQTADAIVKRAQQGNPQEVVATVVTHVLQQLYQAATQAGQQVDMVTLLVTGIQIIGDLTEMLIAAGVVQKDGAEQFIAEASKIAVDQHNQQVQAGGGGDQQPQPQGAMQ